MYLFYTHVTNFQRATTINWGFYFLEFFTCNLTQWQFEGLFDNYIMAGIDSLGLQIGVNLSGTNNYTILPASAENPRNLCSEPVTHPPPFMPTVREMRKRYVSHTRNTSDINEKNRSTSKKAVQIWKTENKSIYGTKVVRKLICFPYMF